LVVTYCAAPPGRLLATIGSRETLEIAINMGSAADHLGFGPGTALRVCGTTSDHPTDHGSDR
jgi:S-adenosylmethionine hydrolase